MSRTSDEPQESIHDNPCDTAPTRTDPHVGDAGAGATPDCRYNYTSGTYQSVGKLKDFWQSDVTLRVELPWETTATLSVQNLFDKDPPFAQSFYNYDVTNGNPLGRVFKVGVKKTF